ncbi:LysR family transcriptional regulator [Falsirhodobacter algicola]|uniref:LysR family transcriptional regulator n=1 Tax=Falsirhodobacter algicola TaxID=2692330 RepID=A0A8J8MS08_9RHOB|nr:LysR substrate-binding domain-containing protein [Falsirhodobacter algicola]QUS35660.1 LysR family transcriptional regulator [Falsirhodobacter algicola]
MKHRQLEAFRHVMRTGTTAKAASLMCVTQPAVSRLITDLESHLGFNLFDRNKGRLYPTPEALKFFGGVERFFIGVGELENAAKQIREHGGSALRISATPALSTGVLPGAIAEFLKLHPKASVEIETASFSQIALRLQTFQTDMGIAHAFPDLPGIEQRVMARVDHVCAMHEDHRLASQEVIRPQDLTGENVLRIIPEGNMNWNDTRSVLDRAAIRFRSDLGTQSSHTGYAMIAEHLAVGVIEPFAAASWRRNGVVTRPFEPRITYDYVVALPEDQPLSRMAREFIPILHERMGAFETPEGCAKG